MSPNTLTVLLCLLAVGLWSAMPQAHAREGRRPAASFSYCGFGTGAADSSMEPGGGGDTLVISDPQGIYHFVYDSSSPVTLTNHDRILFQSLKPSDIAMKRIDDGLALCVADRQYELFLDGQYCRSAQLSDADTDNNEIEEIAFVEAREIWLADTLFEARLKSADSYPPKDSADYGGPPPPEWTIRRFSELLPDYGRKASTCAR